MDNKTKRKLQQTLCALWAVKPAKSQKKSSEQSDDDNDDDHSSRVRVP